MSKNNTSLSERVLHGGLLQSKLWADFQKELGKEVFSVKSGEARGLVIINSLPLVGNYLYIPRGPIFSTKKKENEDLLNKIKRLASEKGAGWVRFEFQEMKDKESVPGLVFKSFKNHQPSETLILDLKKSSEEILAGMKQKTRYNIRLAEKKKIEIKAVDSLKDLESFIELVEETAERDGVNFHDGEYYKKMFQTILRDNLVLLMAYKNEKPIGGVLVSFFGGVATYLHGASSNEHRNLMANYLLQWEAIKMAKKKGMKKYDFFGIAVNLNKRKWAGITRFKMGFSSEERPTIFPGCYDLVLRPVRYLIYRILQIFK